MSDVESYFFKRSVVDFEMASSLVDLQHDADESRQIAQWSDQKSLNNELDHQQRSQNRTGLAQAKEGAAALCMDTGLAML